MRRMIVALLTLSFLTVLFAPAVALAADDWCDLEPPVQVVVDGKPLLVNVTISVQRQDLPLAHTATVTGSVQGNTVTITVVGPNAPFKTWANIRRLNLAAGDATIHSAGSTAVLTFQNVQP